MIETVPSAEIAKNGYKNGPVQIWSHAFLQKCRPWFYVDWCDDQKLSPTQPILLGTPEKLKEFSELHAKSIRMVYLVTPPHINCSNSWKFEPLSSISVLPCVVNDCQVFIYELENGSKYADLRVDNPNEISSADPYLKFYCQ